MLKFDNSYYKVNNLPFIKLINQLDDKINKKYGSLVHLDILDNHIFLDIYDNVLTIYALFLKYLSDSDFNYTKLDNYNYNQVRDLISVDFIPIIKNNNLTAGSSYIVFIDDNSYLFILFDIQSYTIYLKCFNVELDSLHYNDFITILKGKIK